MNAQFTARAIKAVSLAMAKKDVRYYLNGMLLQITNKQCRLVATDGHRLHLIAIENVDEIPAGQYIIPCELIDDILKGGKSKLFETVDIIISDMAVSLTRNGKTISVKLIDGRFPEYKNIIPEKTTGEYCWCNPEYLADVEKACGYAGVKFKLPSFNGEGAAMVQSENFLAVVMPMRTKAINQSPSILDDFFK